ncbi:hypothetical protein B0H14DRAFT_2632388 [Mycena olivaceomarginata]|nr:hypothetical protein B0H14DRAFT_2632388 [Mycena olivaceomarginata]
MSGPSAVGCPMFCVFCMGCPMGFLAWDIPSAAGGTEKFVGYPMWPKKRAFLRAFLGGLGLGGVILEACVQGFYKKLGLRAAIPRSTVALGLRAVFRAARLHSGWGCGRLFRAARLRSGCGRYSAQHGCARVAGGIPHSMVALGLRAAIPRSTVALALRAAIPRSTVVLGLQAAIPRSTVALGLQVAFCAARLHLGCG